jgi:hypothetical protein
MRIFKIMSDNYQLARIYKALFYETYSQNRQVVFFSASHYKQMDAFKSKQTS